MKESERLEQGNACLHFLNSNQEHIFCVQKAPIFEQTLNAAKRASQDATLQESKFRKEHKEAADALVSLSGRAVYYSAMLVDALPHVEVVRRLKSPDNDVEKDQHADIVIELIQSHAGELYFADEALNTLLPLDQNYEKEDAEAATAKEAYHTAISLKNQAIDQLSTRIVEVKRFVRRAYGLQSRQYQAIKDSVFTHPSKKNTKES